jgi:uncharacterized membrane protein
MPEPPSIPPVTPPGVNPAPSREGDGPHVSRVAAGRGVAWWSEGWRLFAAAPAVWLAIAAVYFVLTLALIQVPAVGAPAASLLAPILAAGALVGARAVARGQPLTVMHLFSCFDPRAGPLLVLGLLYLAGWFVIWLVAAVMLVAIAGLGTLGAVLADDAVDAALGAVAAIGVAAIVVLVVMALFAVPLLMAIWFAPALVVFADVEPVAAMKASFSACLVNVLPFLLYNLVGLGLAVLATIPLGLGWLVFAPVLAGSVYASYVDVFGARD